MKPEEFRKSIAKATKLLEESTDILSELDEYYKGSLLVYENTSLCIGDIEEVFNQLVEVLQNEYMRAYFRD